MRLELPMLILSLAFLVAFVTSELATLDPRATGVLGTVEALIWAAFTGELAALLWTAPRKRQALRTHWLDAVIVLAPFLRVLRVTRLVRVVRATSLVGRAGTAINDVTSRRGFRGFVLCAVVLVTGLGTLAWGFERQSADSPIQTLGDGLWWALVTSTTVGYGDTFPITSEGRVIAGMLMVVGVALFSVVTASVAAYFVERDAESEVLAKLTAVEARLDELLTQRAGHPDR